MSQDVVVDMAVIVTLILISKQAMLNAFRLKEDSFHQVAL